MTISPATRTRWTRTATRLDHQGFLDAVLAAQERLIIIGQGFDPHTNTRIPVARGSPRSRAGGLGSSASEPRIAVVSHGLYPYSAASFTGPVASFDRSAYAAATLYPLRLLLRRAGDSCEPAPSAVSLRDLLAFLRHPARELVKVRCGLPVYDSDEWTGDLRSSWTGWVAGTSARMLTAVRLGDGIEDRCMRRRTRTELCRGRWATQSSTPSRNRSVRAWRRRNPPTGSDRHS